MCWKCGKPLDAVQEIFRTSECPVCGADLHCCRNCRFYAPGSHYDCHETVDELVQDKEHANFCDSFSVRTDFSGKNSAADASAKARDAFNSLFGSLISL